MSNLPETEPKIIRGITNGKIYDCGCKAEGSFLIPDYCPEHGSYEELLKFKQENCINVG